MFSFRKSDLAVIGVLVLLVIFAPLPAAILIFAFGYHRYLRRYGLSLGCGCYLMWMAAALILGLGKAVFSALGLI